MVTVAVSLTNVTTPEFAMEAVATGLSVGTAVTVTDVVPKGRLSIE